MTYTLYIANKRYSSWSMRPWVLLKALNIPFDEKLEEFQDEAPPQTQFLAFSPTGKVPCLHDTKGEGLMVWDSLAILEYVAETHKNAWPSDTAARAFARCASAEMHSGFGAMRDECSMNAGLRIELGTPSEALQRDFARFSALFKEGLDKFGGPWLAGSEFTAVDAFFSPIASRCKTYGVELEGPAHAYLERLFEHPAVQQWLEAGIKETTISKKHEDDCVTEGRTVLRDLSKERS